MEYREKNKVKDWKINLLIFFIALYPEFAFMRIASIDIGTNTFRILVGEARDKELKKLYIDRVITRLGGGFGKERRIPEDAAARAVRVLGGFASILKEYGVERVRAIATSVVRESINGYEFLEKVRRETGIRAEVISGEEEARLTVKGVLKSVSVNSAYSLIFDVGGGSTEYALVEGGEILGLKSTNLGVVHLTERFLKGDIPSKSDIDMISGEIWDVLSSELSWMSRVSDNDLTLIGTAGTPTTLAAIKLGLEKYDPNLVNGFILKKNAALDIFNTLIGIPAEKRLEIKGLEKGREDVIIPGALIVIKTMERFSKDEIVVSDGGLLEGVAYSISP
jgi:exopolyphosphatase/guanosine-5'-triphosphate,3'-diphosphate pyrophosphatase